MSVLPLLNRRSFTAFLAAAFAAPALPALTVRGVPLGLQSFTFHNVREGGMSAVDTMIDGLKSLHVDLLELWTPVIEPFALPAGYWTPYAPGAPTATRPTPEEQKAKRDALRAWRTNTPPGFFSTVRRKFAQAGVRVFAYNYTFEPTMTDAEIDAGFLQAQALGIDLISASSKVSVAQRVVPFAAKHKMRVAFHNHSSKDPDEMASPDSFARVLAMSPLYRVNLDVAHFAAAGFDSVGYLQQHHDVITHLHVHDRKANDGASVPFGQGVAPTREVLLLLRDKGWNIPVFYELEYPGADGRDVIAETRRELDYERRVLES